MILTKEHQEAMIENYKKDNHSLDEVIGFIDGMNAIILLVIKNQVIEENN